MSAPHDHPSNPGKHRRSDSGQAESAYAFSHRRDIDPDAFGAALESALREEATGSESGQQESFPQLPAYYYPSYLTDYSSPDTAYPYRYCEAHHSTQPAGVLAIESPASLPGPSGSASHGELFRPKGGGGEASENFPSIASSSSASKPASENNPRPQGAKATKQRKTNTAASSSVHRVLTAVQPRPTLTISEAERGLIEDRLRTIATSVRSSQSGQPLDAWSPTWIKRDASGRVDLPRKPIPLGTLRSAGGGIRSDVAMTWANRRTRAVLAASRRSFWNGYKQRKKKKTEPETKEKEEKKYVPASELETLARSCCLISADVIVSNAALEGATLDSLTSTEEISQILDRGAKVLLRAYAQNPDTNFMVNDSEPSSPAP